MMKKFTGFTLLELLIVITIIGIISAIAFPSYQRSLSKSRRTTAQADLTELASFMERLYTETNCYNPGPDNDCLSTGDNAAPTLPFTESPKDAGAKYYDMTVVSATTTFTLTTTIKGTSAQVGDLCGNMTLTNTGVKTDTGSLADCW